MLIFMVIFSCATLEGAGEGVAYYFKPDFEKLAKPQAWVGIDFSPCIFYDGFPFCG